MTDDVGDPGGVGKMTNAYGIILRESAEKRPLGRTRRRWRLM